MAVTKMSKLTAIADQRHQEKLLQTIQGTQNVEIRDLKQENASNSWVREYFSDTLTDFENTKAVDFDQLQKNIQAAITFVQRYGSKGKSAQLKRSYLSLQELEAGFTDDTFQAELQEILLLEKNWQELTAQQEKLEEEENWLYRWLKLDIEPSQKIGRFAELELIVVPSNLYDDFKHDSQSIENFYSEEIFTDEKETNLAVIYGKTQQAEIAQLFEKFAVTKVNYPYTQEPAKQMQQLKEQLTTIQKQLKEISQQVGAKVKFVPNLQWGEEVLLARSQRETVKNQLVRSPYLIIVQGWVATNDQAELTAEINREIGPDEVFLAFEEPSKEEISAEVPTKLENNPIVAPFEMLTEMYSLPKYEEIDPTPWMMPFYFVFFGMMVADVGYGLLMLVATTIALKLLVLPRNMIRFAKFFQILAIPTMLWGFIYGSFFGLVMPYPPILSTEADVIQILGLSVIFGFVQILVGLFLAAKEHIKHQDYLSAIGDGFAWQGILVGIAIAVDGTMVLNNQTITMLGIIVAVVSAIGVLAVPVIQSKSKLKGIAKGAYALYGITGYIGDLVSYTRLMALGISGGSIAAAFNLIVGYLPTGARFTVGILLLVALHALNIFLSLLSAFVHGARLQYVEFFGKFFQGGGRSFAPFKTHEKYVNIKRKEE